MRSASTGPSNFEGFGEAPRCRVCHHDWRSPVSGHHRGHPWPGTAWRGAFRPGAGGALEAHSDRPRAARRSATLDGELGGQFRGGLRTGMRTHVGGRSRVVRRTPRPATAAENLRSAGPLPPGRYGSHTTSLPVGCGGNPGSCRPTFPRGTPRPIRSRTCVPRPVEDPTLRRGPGARDGVFRAVRGVVGWRRRWRRLWSGGPPRRSWWTSSSWAWVPFPRRAR